MIASSNLYFYYYHENIEAVGNEGKFGLLEIWIGVIVWGGG